MATLADVYREINALKEDGVVENYAIGGAMGALFYTDTTPTYDVAVFVVIPQTGILVSLTPIYDWARARGYEVRDEYILFHSVPVQFLVANPGLETEAIATAGVCFHGGEPVRVMRPEYLIALYTKTGGQKRQGRSHDLFDEDSVDRKRLKDLLERFDLMALWRQKGGEGLEVL